MFDGGTFRIILVISLMVLPFDGKYLMVKIEEQINEFTGAIKSRTSGNLGPYSTKVMFNDRFKESCINEKLVKKGSFTMKKFAPGIGWIFQAILKKGSCFKKDKILSTLTASTGGVCNLVVTDPGSYKCGLATSLMEFCFTDPDIGTYNLEESSYFQNKKAEHYRDLAISNCDHMVYVKCIAEPHSACSGYLTAAINTGHKMLFTYDKLPEKWSVLEIATAKTMLKSNSDTFIDDYGNMWFFCKCKSDRIPQCENMQ